MKKFIIISLLIVCLGLAASAQQYITVTQICPRCMGYRLIPSYYGPVICPGCCGYGVIQVTVPNPNYYQVPFQNDGYGYVHKGKISLQRVVGGTYDTFEYYVKGTIGYAKYGSVYHPLNGRYVTINNIRYFSK